MLTRWLTQLEKVHKAETREEYEAIYRFRYAIYVEEFGRELSAPDHERKWVSDEDDEKDFSTILYTGHVGDITGTVRLRHWRPGEVPHHEFEELSMDLIPDIEERAVAEIGRFMIRKSMRGKLILASFARIAYDLLAGEKETDLTFCYCAPGLVRFYRKLGARPFGGSVVHTPDGMMVPLVSVMSDHDYFKRMGSPLAPMVRRHFGPRKRRPISLEPYRHLFDAEAAGIEVDAEKIWENVQDAFLEEPPKSLPFLDSLPPDAVKNLASGGFVMDVPAGTLVTRKGHGEREMFVVLEGRFEVLDEEKRLAVLGKGELFGEVAFFSRSGERSASVRSLVDSKVLVLRARSLEKLIEKQPAVAARVLLGIGGIMAERLAVHAG